MINNLPKYTTHYGPFAALLSTEPFPNGNMLGATGQLVFLQPSQLSSTEYLIYNNGIHICEELPGIYARHPSQMDNTSVDDYLAMTCDYYRAKRTLLAARCNLGFLDINQTPSSKRNWAQFMFRFQGLWQHMKISAMERVGPIGRIIWALSIIIAARRPFSNQDSWCQSHLMILVKRRRQWNSIIGELAIKYWVKKKGSMKTSQIMTRYVGDPQHPLVQAWEQYN